jgi:hypothetical protein
MATTTVPTGKKPLLYPKEIILGLVVLLIFAVLYAVTLTSYNQEGQANGAPFVIGTENLANGLNVTAKVITIDPIKGELALRVDLVPTGDMTADEGLTANANLKVFINSATGTLERSFEKGKTISPFDVVISLDGMASDYPFDAYASQLYMYATAQENKDAETVDVPVAINLAAHIPGFAINVSPDKESKETYPLANIEVARSATVKTVVIAGMVIMWVIGISTIFLTMAFVFRSRKAEAFAFYSGLLFGLFGLRNSLPATPPIGTQSDFLAFLWVEAIVAIMMVINISFSLLRPQK